MALDMFLVLTPATGQPPVSGEPFQDPYFKLPTGSAAVEIREFSFGVENQIAIGSTTSGAGAGKMEFNEFSIAKPVDKLSRSLFQISAVGGHLARAQLYLRKAGATTGAKPYLAYGFEIVAISKIEWSGSLGDDEPSEHVTFEYGALAVGYYPQKADGTFDVPVKTAWSVITNTAPPADPILTGF
jgi:type VI secretion system secreted protein Hcp